MSRKPIYPDLTGQKFNFLTVIEKLAERINGKIYYKCLCDCGKHNRVTPANLVKNKTKSCGCRNGIKKVKPTANHMNTVEMKLKAKIAREEKLKREKEKLDKIEVSRKNPMRLLELTEYHTGKSVRIISTHIMNMEEMQINKEHIYTALYKYKPFGGEMYKVREKISEINTKQLQIRMSR